MVSALQVSDAVSSAQDVPLPVLKIVDKQLVVSESLSDLQLLLLVPRCVS